MKKFINFLKFIAILFLLIIAFIFIAHNATWGHERLHKKIFSRYFIESEMNVSIFTGIVMPTNLSEYDKCNDACKTQHTINDVISYEMDNLINTLFALFFIYLLYRGWIKNETHN